jgi:hypothetical protein
MTGRFVKGQSGNPLGRLSEKPYHDALRMEIAAAGKDHKALRRIARNLIAQAQKDSFDALPAINAIADRLDGKPAQSSTVMIEKFDSYEWTRAELESLLHDAFNGGGRVIEAQACSSQPDPVHGSHLPALSNGGTSPPDRGSARASSERRDRPLDAVGAATAREE